MNKFFSIFGAVLSVIILIGFFPAGASADKGKSKSLIEQIQNPLYLCNELFAVKCKVNLDTESKAGEISPKELHNQHEIFSKIMQMLKKKGYEFIPPCGIGKRLKVGIYVIRANSPVKKIAIQCSPRKPKQFRVKSSEMHIRLEKEFTRFTDELKKSDLNKLVKEQIEWEKEARSAREAD